MQLMFWKKKEQSPEYEDVLLVYHVVTLYLKDGERLFQRCAVTGEQQDSEACKLYHKVVSSMAAELCSRGVVQFAIPACSNMATVYAADIRRVTFHHEHVPARRRKKEQKNG